MVRNARITPGIAEMPISIIASTLTVESSTTLNQAATSMNLLFQNIHIVYLKIYTQNCIEINL